MNKEYMLYLTILFGTLVLAYAQYLKLTHPVRFPPNAKELSFLIGVVTVMASLLLAVFNHELVLPLILLLGGAVALFVYIRGDSKMVDKYNEESVNEEPVAVEKHKASPASKYKGTRHKKYKRDK